MKGPVHTRFGAAWFLFALTLALHVIDEVNHHFLAYYNPNARMIRERFGIPIPVFTPEMFALTLGAAVLLLLLLTPSAFRGAPWLRWIAVPLAIIVGICNALLHIIASIYYHRFMPGLYSSPILLAAAIFLLVAANPRKRSNAATA
jgi:Protein of unknown function with HXXEE motif